MALNGVMALSLRYISPNSVPFLTHCVKVVEGVVVKKSSRSLSRRLTSFLFSFFHCYFWFRAAGENGYPSAFGRT